MELKPPFLNLTKEEQKSALEVMLFAAEEPLSLKYLFDLLIVNNADFNSFDEENNSEDDSREELQISLNQEIMKKFDVSPSYFNELISEINIDLVESNRPYQINNIAGGYQFATLPEYGELIQRLTKSKSKRKFTRASLESLSIIAYKQPVSKPEIEQIRGVNSNEIVNSLLEKNFIKIVGRRDALGRPLLYGTTNLFLKTFGLKNLEDLPKLREIEDIASDESSVNSHIEVTIDVNNSVDAESLQEEIDDEFGISDNVEKPEDLDINPIDKSEDSESEDNLSSQEFVITHEEAEKNFF